MGGKETKDKYAILRGVKPMNGIMDNRYYRNTNKENKATKAT